MVTLTERKEEIPIYLYLCGVRLGHWWVSMGALIAPLTPYTISLSLNQDIYTRKRRLNKVIFSPASAAIKFESS